MKILIAIESAAFRSLKIWKGVLIVWLSSLLMVSMVAMPMKMALKSGLGASMITEKLADGINVEVFSDMGASFKNLASYFSAGLFITILISLIVNSFLTAGLFDSLKGAKDKFLLTEFFRAAAKYFWPFMVISFIISLIVILLLVLVIIVPVSFISQSEASAGGSVLKNLLIFSSVFMFLLSIMLLVADYARAWQVTNESNACFSAIGFGFSRTFRTFFISLPLMIILLTVQFLFGWLVISILPGMKPVDFGGIVQLFLLSQFLFFIKILLKAWRYGSVTSMMEQTNHLSEADPDQEGSGFQHHQDLT